MQIHITKGIPVDCFLWAALLHCLYVSSLKSLPPVLQHPFLLPNYLVLIFIIFTKTMRSILCSRTTGYLPFLFVRYYFARPSLIFFLRLWLSLKFSVSPLTDCIRYRHSIYKTLKFILISVSRVYSHTLRLPSTEPFRHTYCGLRDMCLSCQLKFTLSITFRFYLRIFSNYDFWWTSFSL